MISGTHPLDQEVSVAFSTPVGGAILQTLGAIGPAHAAVFLHRVGHFLSARPQAVSIQSGWSQMALGGRGGRSGRGWLCLLGWTPALLLFNTQTQHHQLQLSSSPAAIQHTNPTPSATIQFQLCCYSTHKFNTLSYNSVPALLLFDTQIQYPQLQLNSSSAVIRHTNPIPSATTQFQEADCTPGLCYTTRKPNSVSYSSTPESRKQTASQACVI